jgi:transposase-like protein
MVQEVRRYSEAFKRQVVEELEQGKFTSAFDAQQSYGILGDGTVSRWMKKYGRDNLFPKLVRIETMKEKDRVKEARMRIRNLETALSDAHIDNCLEHAFLEIACERMGISVEDFKKKHELTLSDVRKMRDLK